MTLPAATVESRAPRIAVVVPCFRVAAQILGVLAAMPDCVSRVYCVDDACPEQSGARVERECGDPRVTVLRHAVNRGVGAAMVSGYRAALAEDMDIVVKIDGDGQMDPRLLPRFLRPLLAQEADYTKGNRFHHPARLGGMPLVRLIGNAALSFLTKLSSGYWQVFDANNGYTAIHAAALRLLPLEDLDPRYFFEADMLFRLNIVRAVVRDIPMDAVYGDEPSSLRVREVLPRFALKHLRNFVKRVVYSYYLRDFNLASIELPLGLAALLFGASFGASHWLTAWRNGTYASAGTVMVAALPVIVGVQMLLSAVNYDVQNVPAVPLARLLDGNQASTAPRDEHAAQQVNARDHHQP